MIKTIFNLCIITGLTSFAHGQDASSLSEAIKNGTPSIELRLGYEHSSTDDQNSPAEALNLRFRLGYRTANYLDTNVFVQFHSLSNWVENFRFPGGGDAGHDVIADPDGERIHQGYLEYHGLTDTTLRLGRQEILLDDVRLIGNIGWRQNGQSFDGVLLTNNSAEDLTLKLAVIGQTNTPLLTHEDLDHLILLNAHYSYQEGHHIALYSYLLDTEKSTDNSRDSATYGTRLNGSCGNRMNYDISYTIQGDYGHGKVHDGEMIKAFLGTSFDLFSVGVGYNRISGQDGQDAPFDTLFSTAHKYNGWADQFTATNGGSLVGGLEDAYVQVGTEFLGAAILIRYHIFDTVESTFIGSDATTDTDDNHGGEYGDEIDVDITRKITDELTAQITYAFYNETDEERNGVRNRTTDEEIFWARLIYQF